MSGIWNNFVGLMPDKSILQHSTKYFFFLSLVLSAWTHPKYYHSRLARCLRVPLSLISATWWLCYPFLFLVEPRETKVSANIGNFAWTYVMMTKCLDWGLFSGPQHRRRYVRSSDDSAGAWEAAEKNLKDRLPPSSLIDQVLLQLTSMRGSQFPWGHFSKLNHNSLGCDMLKFLICHIYSLTVLAGLLYMEKLSTTSTIQSFVFLGRNVSLPTLVFMARFMSTPILLTGLCASFEAMNSALAVLAHLTHPLLCRLGFPDVICEFADPVYYPPLFENVFAFNSLSEFWGKTWHQLFRRSFVVLGAFPLGGMTRALGFSTQAQKMAGFVGAFMASGFMHAYPFFLMADPTTSHGNVSRLEIFCVFLCFVVQSLGALIEPILIPLIPKRLGGGRLWTISFLLLTLPLFSMATNKPARLFSIFKPLDEWSIHYLFLPAVLTPIVL
ncbi:uncharacterized protein PGTG_06431 [Puccinia graminis f. sp. tritici CRL 75-36-700-3]|uniref:Wax synthase domain-containing protein n=1 Tax=Puccinia graminis f. sp. tritici (strain CRL 75-36-700-3 / race SCCL) TaxID=418459 RepID=E3K7H1_PUCGT|nr:uncharacterized protein PGTG_06431 [Puccinia graminis f. sp. tritici CRL 75-36-700-3]EFP80475.1 hypothetical protein PGTG_06431 [Puccinia graminis f. sp. tritici CRL 75-36-700-3]